MGMKRPVEHLKLPRKSIKTIHGMFCQKKNTPKNLDMNFIFQQLQIFLIVTGLFNKNPCLNRHADFHTMTQVDYRRKAEAEEVVGGSRWIIIPKISSRRYVVFLRCNMNSKALYPPPGNCECPGHLGINECGQLESSGSANGQGMVGMRGITLEGELEGIHS